MTSSGIEPATYRLVAQYFNQLRNRVPMFLMIGYKNVVHWGDFQWHTDHSKFRKNPLLSSRTETGWQIYTESGIKREMESVSTQFRNQNIYEMLL
jgi:hypothetical protein